MPAMAPVESAEDDCIETPLSPLDGAEAVDVEAVDVGELADNTALVLDDVTEVLVKVALGSVSLELVFKMSSRDGAWKDKLVGLPQVTVPLLSVPQHFHNMDVLS